MVGKQARVSRMRIEERVWLRPRVCVFVATRVWAGGE
jgi:hypothetical protein